MGCACGLPFDLMEAADGSSNKSRLLVKEPIARKGRNKSRAVLHRSSCYLLWHGVVSPVGGGDGRLRLQSSSRSAPPPFLLLPVSLPSPSLVSSLLGYTLDRCLMASKEFTCSPGIQFLPNFYCCAVWFGQIPPLLCASCPHLSCCFKKHKKSLSRLHVCMWGT